MNEDLEFKDIDEDDEEEVKIPEIHGTKNYMTRACYNRLLDERKNLVLVERPNVVNVVAWAASNGDRLNKRIEASEVIDIDKRPPTDQIFFGATIVYANEQGDESKIRIVGIDEADASVGDVSWISPIARVFLKHFEGDTVLLPTPKGVKKLEILEVTYVNDPPGKPHII